MLRCGAAWVALSLGGRLPARRRLGLEEEGNEPGARRLKWRRTEDDAQGGWRLLLQRWASSDCVRAGGQ
jgi:hypothetical protein